MRGDRLIDSKGDIALCKKLRMKKDEDDEPSSEEEEIESVDESEEEEKKESEDEAEMTAAETQDEVVEPKAAITSTEKADELPKEVVEAPKPQLSPGQIYTNTIREVRTKMEADNIYFFPCSRCRNPGQMLHLQQCVLCEHQNLFYDPELRVNEKKSRIA